MQIIYPEKLACDEAQLAVIGVWYNDIAKRIESAKGDGEFLWNAAMCEDKRFDMDQFEFETVSVMFNKRYPRWFANNRSA